MAIGNMERKGEKFSNTKKPVGARQYRLSHYSRYDLGSRGIIFAELSLPSPNATAFEPLKLFLLGINR